MAETPKAAPKQGKPTPTQAENDRSVMGEYIAKHEDDGSDPEPVQPKPGPPTPAAKK